MIILTALTGVFAGPRAAALAAPPVINRATALHSFEPPVRSRVWKSIVVHHSATSGGSVASIDEVHRTHKDAAGQPWRGIGYHFVVGNGQPMIDGQIEPTFRWKQQLEGAHAGSRELNENGIGVCLIGNFQEHRPTSQQMAALGALLETLTKRYAIPPDRVVRHSAIQTTLCPGRLFPWDEMISRLRSGPNGS